MYVCVYIYTKESVKAETTSHLLVKPFASLFGSVAIFLYILSKEDSDMFSGLSSAGFAVRADAPAVPYCSPSDTTALRYVHCQPLLVAPCFHGRCVFRKVKWFLLIFQICHCLDCPCCLKIFFSWRLYICLHIFRYFRKHEVILALLVILRFQVLVLHCFCRVFFWYIKWSDRSCYMFIVVLCDFHASADHASSCVFICVSFASWINWSPIRASRLAYTSCTAHLS